VPCHDYHGADKGGYKRVNLGGFRFLASLPLELGEFLLFGFDLFLQFLELFLFMHARVLVLMSLFLLAEALRLGDGTLGVNVRETATEHGGGDGRDTTSDGISDSDGEHW